jgi:hypothetical protein
MKECTDLTLTKHVLSTRENTLTPLYNMKLKVLMAMSIKTGIFWVVTPSSLIRSVLMFHMILQPPSKTQSLTGAAGTSDISGHIHMMSFPRRQRYIQLNMIHSTQ